jgi:cell division protein FtsL
VTPPAATVAGRRRATGMRPARSSRVARGRPPRRVSGPARPASSGSAAPAAPAAPAALRTSRPAGSAARAAAPAAPRTSRPAASAQPRTTRRTSGPAARPVASDRPIAAFGGRLAAAAAAALPLPATRPSAPPRQRPRAVPRPARRPDLPLGARALAWLRALPDHRLLDRLIGGRIWIVLLGTLLVGIVTMQLTLLRMNAGIGRAVERSSALEQSNAALRLENSQLSDSERITALASQMGFVTPLQGSPRYVSASAADAGKALTTMRVPNPAAIAAATATTTTDPSATSGTTASPVDATSTDTTGTAPATTTPAPAPAATTTPATGTTAGTSAPATGTTVPATSATPIAGGASAPVGPQG